MSLLLCMIESQLWSCTVLSLPCGPTLLGVYLIGKQKGRQHAHTHTQPFAIAVKKGSPVSQDLLSQGIQSTFHDASSSHGIPKYKCEPCATTRKLKVSLGACTGQLVTCIPCSIGLLRLNPPVSLNTNNSHFRNFNLKKKVTK